MESSNVWEQHYQKTKQLWSSNPNSKLLQYIELVKDLA